MASNPNKFISRLEEMAAKGEAQINERAQKVAQQAENKKAQFDLRREALKEGYSSYGAMQEMYAAQDAADALTAVGQLGLDPNGVLGTIVNGIYTPVSGAARLVGNVGALTTQMNAQQVAGHIPGNVYDAYNRELEGKATTEDTAILDKVEISNENALKMSFATQGQAVPGAGLSFRDRINAARESQQAGQKFREHVNLDHVVHRGRQRELSKDIQRTFDENKASFTKDNINKALGGDTKAIADVLSSAWNMGNNALSDLASNPIAVLEYVGESSIETGAMIAGGPAGIALASASNIGYAADYYQRGLAEYEVKYGKVADAETRQEMALRAATLAGAEMLGDTVAGIAGKPLTAAGRAVAKSGKAGGMLASAVAPVGRVAGTMGVEASTEGYQEYTESKIMGDNPSASRIFEAAVIGAGSGGTIAIAGEGGRAAGNIANKAAETATLNSVDAGKASPEAQAAAKKAIETGDISELVNDSSSPAYNPSVAIATLNRLANDPKATPEQKDSYFRQAEQLSVDLAKKVEEDKNTLKGGVVTSLEEKIKGYRQAINDNGLKEGDAQYGVINDAITQTEELIKQEKDNLNNKEYTDSIKNSITTNEKYLKSVDENIKRFQTQTASNVDVSTSLADIKSRSTTTEQKTAAVDNIITASLGSSIDLNSSDIDRVVADTNNGLTDEQRETLRSISAARQAENAYQTLNGTQKEIYEGNKAKKMLGLKDYRSRIGAALRNNDTQAVETHMGWLNNFADTHASKAKAAEDAWAQGKGIQIARNNDGTWFVNDTPLKGKARNENGAREVNSPKLVEAIRTEADLINKTRDELQNIINTKVKSSANQATRAPAPAQTNINESDEDNNNEGNENNGSNVPQNEEGTPPGESGGNLDEQGNEENEGAPSNAGVGGRVGTSTPASTPKTPEEGNLEGEEGNSNSENNVSEPTPPEVNDEGDLQDNESLELVETETFVEPNPEAKLDVFNQAESEANTPYDQRNLIRDFFKQTLGGKTKENAHALVWVKNLLSSVGNNYNQLFSFAGDFTPTTKQVEAVQNFIEFADVFADQVTSNIKPRTARFRYEDLAQFFIKEGTKKPEFEENINTALAYAAYSWLAENSNNALFNRDDQINDMLGFDENKGEHASPVAKKIFRDVGIREAFITADLGKRAMTALGLKMNKDAHVNLKAQLEQHLGAYVIKTMYDMGAMERVEVPTAVVAKHSNKSVKVAADTSYYYARPATQKGNRFALTQDVQNVVEANRGTQSVINRIFANKYDKNNAKLKPVKTRQAVTKEGQPLPKRLIRIINKMNRKPYKVNKDANTPFMQMSPENQILVAGGKDPSGVMSDYTREAVVSKNEGLAREIANFKEHIEDTLQDNTDTEYYLQHVMWDNQRVGIATVVNPQASKVHRYLSMMPKWETRFKMDNTKLMDSFKLRVLEGFGVKTDREMNADSIQRYESTVSDPVIAKAVEAVRASIFDGVELNTNQQADIVAAVQQGGEAMHSYNSLVALAKYNQAIKNGDTEFRATITGEVDGVTNGPMLAHIITGAAAFGKDLMKAMAKGGFYPKGDTFKNFNAWRSQPGAKDLYQELAAMVIKISGYKYTEDLNLSDKFHAVAAVVGNLGSVDNVSSKGRNLVKRAIAAIHFGSSIKSAVDGTFNDFVDSLYTKLDNVLAGKDISIPEYINMLKTLGVNTKDLKADGIQSLVFTAGDLKNLNSTFNEVLGANIAVALETKFADFIEQRDAVNLAANTAFAMYEAAFNSMRDKRLAEIAKEQGVAVKDLIFDLTAQDIAEIQESLASLSPAFASFMSLESGQPETGVNPMVRGKKTAIGVKAYQTNVAFNKPTPDGKAKVLRHSAEMRTVAAPGVRAVSFGTHSLDSGIMHSSLEDRFVLGIHDAVITGAHDIESAAHSLNKSTFDAISKYNLVAEAHNSLIETAEAFSDMFLNGDIAPEHIAAMAKAIRYADIHQIAEHTKSVADKAEKVRQDFINELGAVDQYASENGEYTVGDIKYEPVRVAGNFDTIQVATTRIHAEGLKTASAADSRSEAKSAPKVVSKAPKPTVNTSKPGSNQITPWGMLGEPRVAPNQDLHNILSSSPQVSLHKIAGKLREAIAKDQGKYVILPVFDAAMKALGKTPVTIRYITKNSPAPTDEYTTFAEGSYNAWYHTQITNDGKGGTTILVRSPEFINSDVSSVVLVHEIVHAATAALILAEKQKKNKNPKYTSDVLSIVTKLEEDMVAVRNHLTATGKLDKNMEYAISNVEEYITHGLTQKEFMVELKQVQVKPSKVGGKLLNAAKAFIDSIAALIFRNPTENNSNALGSVVNYSSALMYEASQRINTYYQEGVEVTDDTAGFGSATSATAKDFTTDEVFDALTNEDSKDTRFAMNPEFVDNMKDILDIITSKAFGPFGSMKNELEQSSAATPLDAWTKAISEQTTPYAEEFLGSPFVNGQSNAFVGEQVYQSMQVAMATNVNSVSTAYREINRMYEGFSRQITPEAFHDGDWATANDVEKDIAKAKYDYVFNTASVKGNRADHLARFVALATTVPELADILKNNNYQDVGVDPTNLSGKLRSAVVRSLDSVSNTINKTHKDDTNDVRIMKLMSNLIDAENKYKASLQKKMNAKDWEEKANTALTSGAGKGKEAVDKVLGTDFFRNNSSKAIRAMAALGRITASDERVDRFVEVLQEYRDSIKTGRQGLIGGMFTEISGHIEWAKKLLRMTKKNEQARKAVIESVGSSVMEGFDGKGSYIDDKGKVALTNILTESGAHVLLDKFTMDEIRNLIENKAARTKAIDDYTNKLNGKPEEVSFWTKQAAALGIFKATGMVKIPNLQLNPYNIAYMFGTIYRNKVDKKVAASNVETINVLATLHTIDNSKSVDRVMAADVMRRENGRTDNQNGVEYVLKMQKAMEEESNTSLFDGNPTQMAFGYSAEIYDPNVTLVVGSAEEVDNYILQGYKVIGDISQDLNDPQKGGVLLALNGVGMSPFMSAAMSMTGKNAKGSGWGKGINTRAETLAMARKNRQGMKTMFDNSVTPQSLQKTKANFMVPVMDENGDIAGYRYMMQNRTKDEILRRDNRIDKVLGHMAGRLMDKMNSEEQNKLVVDALKQDYLDNYATKSNAFLVIGPHSTDQYSRELWARIPDETRSYIRKQFSGPNLYIRKDLETIILGYPKASLADMFHKDSDELNKAQELFTGIVTTAFKHWGMSQRGLNEDDAEQFAKRAANVIRKGERGWQELVAEMKDNIVIKTGTVLFGNIWSNITLLKLYGVPIKDGVRDHNIAIKALMDYQASDKKLQSLLTMKDAGYFSGRTEDDIDKEIFKLRDAIDRNPVRHLIDAGLMPSIVEDLGTTDDPYSYKTYWSQKVSAKTSWVPKPLKTAANYVYMGHDTPLYQILNKATQYSDFVARYALYQHMTTRATNPMDHDSAVGAVADAFVNYDIPLPRSLQYMDDMGIVMFTKYALRIQRVLFNLMKERPASVLSMMALNQLIDMGPYVLEGAMMNKLGNNPFQLGVLGYPGSVADLATIQTASDSLKLLK